jgi:putative membrane protein
MRLVHTALAATLAFASIGCNAQANGPSDPQIASIVVTANQVDIDAGELAETKTQSPNVKAFVQQMITPITAASTRPRPIS